MSVIVAAMDMVLDRVRTDRQALCSVKQSERAATVTAYAVFALCAFVVCAQFTDHDFSLVLTASSGVQCLGLYLLSSKVRSERTVDGLSLKTLEMYALVFVFRLSSTLFKNGYLPVDRSGDWVYQVSDIGSLFITLHLLFLIHKTHRGTYDKEHDTLPVYNFLPACILLACFVHGDLNDSLFFDIMWTISLHIDTVAMLPQLWMLTKMGGEVDAFTSHFVAAMVVSRALSFTFWYYGYEEITPSDQFNGAGYVIMFAHLFQLLLSGDFMYYYGKAILKQTKMQLPSMHI